MVFYFIIYAGYILACVCMILATLVRKNGGAVVLLSLLAGLSTVLQNLVLFVASGVGQATGGGSNQGGIIFTIIMSFTALGIWIGSLCLSNSCSTEDVKEMDTE